MAFLRNWATKNVAKVVENAAEPLKQNLIAAKSSVTNQTGLLSAFAKLLVCLGIGYIVLRESSDDTGVNEKEQKPNIIINNYVNRGEENGTYKPE